MRPSATVYHGWMRNIAGQVGAFGLVLTLVASWAWAEGGEPVERLDVIERAIAFHGGRLYAHSEIRLRTCSKSGCSRVIARVDGGKFDYSVSGTSQGSALEVRATNDQVEVQRDGVAVAVAPEKQQVYRDWAMAKVYFSFLPYRLDDPGVFKQDLGLVTWGDRQLHKVKVTFEAGSSTDASDEYMYWLDPDTAQVELFAYSYDNNGGGLRFRRAVNDRRVGGILFFDQENLGVEGPDLSVDAIDADYVRDKLRPVSTVRLEEITVHPLP